MIIFGGIFSLLIWLSITFISRGIAPKLCGTIASMSPAALQPFIIKAQNLDKKNIYIQSVTLNGESHNNSYITHDDIMNGGELIFLMGSKPNRRWAAQSSSTPYSMSK